MTAAAEAILSELWGLKCKVKVVQGGLPASYGSWWLRELPGCGRIAAVTASGFTPLSPCPCRDACQDSEPHLLLRNPSSITLAKTLAPNEATPTGPQDWDLGISLRGHRCTCLKALRPSAPEVG